MNGLGGSRGLHPVNLGAGQGSIDGRHLFQIRLFFADLARAVRAPGSIRLPKSVRSRVYPSGLATGSWISCSAI